MGDDQLRHGVTRPAVLPLSTPRGRLQTPEGRGLTSMSTQTVPITYGGRIVQVEYRPEAVPLDGGRELERRMHEALDEDDRRELHRQALFEIMVGWDLADPGGAPVPISHEAFDRQVSWFFERLIMQSIIRHG